MADSTILADYMLHRLTGLMANLRIIPENMERNLWSSFGLFFSQAVLLALIETGMDRQMAYERVQQIAMRCWTEKKNFADEVRRDTALTKALGTQKLDQLFDPANFLRQEAFIFNRVFGA
jgi:adenylosuccinate lyase